ncbi:uncharacterized protein LOC141726844 isoform X2 [Zonotrichia albicollis]|uniref:uncharacterized protein LOC141726844 isoform X2 n=1 Tax=Zonotrichia albicollis TaxID=44394 RepID=UPI003D80C50C
MFGELARASWTHSQGTVGFSLPDDPALRSLWRLVWQTHALEEEVQFSPSEEKLIALWQKWCREDGIFLSATDLYEFFRWAKLFGFFTDVLYALDVFVWECMNSIFQSVWGQERVLPFIYPAFLKLFPVLKRRAAIFQWISNCYGQAPFPPSPVGEDPAGDEWGLPGPPCFAAGGGETAPSEEVFFTLSPEPAQTEPSPPPPSLSPGGWEWAVPLEPVPLVPPLPALRPPSRPASPARPPLQAIPSPPLQAVPPLPAPASENAEAALPVAAELLSDDDASPASGSAGELFSPAPPAPLPLPSASSPPQAETVPVQDGAGDGAEPAGPSEKPAAAPTSSEIPSPVPASPPLPAQAAPAVLPLSEAVSSVSASETALEPAACSSSDHPGPVAVAAAPAAGLPFRGAGSARQLTVGAMCLVFACFQAIYPETSSLVCPRSLFTIWVCLICTPIQ